jgi:PAS domain S-box-containing protein
MIRRNQRFTLLALLMVLLVAAMSIFSTRYLYHTAVNEQRVRLDEMVQSQASLVIELGGLALNLELEGGHKISKEVVLGHLSRAHKQFQNYSLSGEFTVARQLGDKINFLIINGTMLTPDDPLYLVPIDSSVAEPMKEALLGNSGTLIGKDYRGVEVLAAYRPLHLQDMVLALVAKVDLSTIQTPFFKANIVVFSIGLGLTAVCILLFYKVSEPIIQDIQRNEKKYRALVEGVSNYILRVDEDGIITFANSFAINMLKGIEQSLIGESFYSIVLNEDEPSDHEDLVDIYKKAQAKEVAVAFKDGTQGWIAWTISLVEGEEGQPSELLCVGNDVTKAHVAAEAKREIEERFRSIAKVSPVGIVITDMNGNLFYANERMHGLTGVDVVGMTGKGWLERIHPKDRKSVVENWFGGNKLFRPSMEFRVVTHARDILWVLGQIVELESAQGEVVGNVLSFTDITEIKEAEREMSRLTTAVEQAAEIVIITDLKGAITYVNNAFETVTGYSREEVIGRNPRILKSGEQDESFYRGLWETLAAGKTWHGRFVNKRKDDKRYTQEATIGPVRDKAGSVVSYFGVARDISDRLVVEAQLRQSQKLESIGELAAGIAHEINTPTQYVSTNLKFLEDSFSTYSKTIKQCKVLIDYLNQTSEKHIDPTLRELVNSSMDFEELQFLSEDIPNALSESETGLKRISEIVQSVKQLAHPGEVSKSYHDLNEIVRNAVTVSSNEWKYVAKISYELTDDLPQLNCLKGEVGQVVLNLIINAAHAIEAKEERGQDYGDIILKTYQAGEMAVLEVTDTGIGIPQKNADRIFDPFFTTKEVGKGTGQGLAITHNVICNMHSGKIDLISEEGVGSTFIIRLPFEGSP